MTSPKFLAKRNQKRYPKPQVPCQKEPSKIHSPEFLAKRNLRNTFKEPAAQTQSPCQKDSSTPQFPCTAQLNPTAQGFTVSTPGAIPPVENIFHEQHKHIFQTVSISNTSIHVSMVLFPTKFVVSCFCGMALVIFFKEAQPLDKRGNVANNKPLAKRGQTCADQQVVENMVL